MKPNITCYQVTQSGVFSSLEFLVAMTYNALLFIIECKFDPLYEICTKERQSKKNEIEEAEFQLPAFNCQFSIASFH